MWNQLKSENNKKLNDQQIQYNYKLIVKDLFALKLMKLEHVIATVYY